MALATAVLLIASSGVPLEGGEREGALIDFNREIRPILSNRCFKCHGRDAKQRKGGLDGLRLDSQEEVFSDLGGYSAIVPGEPDESELILRITAEDPLGRMPPAETGKRLTDQEIEQLTEWIRQGAHYAKHWSYVKPQRPPLPAVSHTTWPRNAVDYFILARLEREGLSQSPEADRTTPIRRLSLDLTGLPPTLDEVKRFVNDTALDAYEKLVDRLLANPAYGEHWARMWLDLARYADSSGYADDPLRTIWAYRDYVIRAFNANKPFDQFTLEQLAGDLLPQATEEQLVATAFHRNTMTNNEEAPTTKNSATLPSSTASIRPWPFGWQPRSAARDATITSTIRSLRTSTFASLRFSTIPPTPTVATRARCWSFILVSGNGRKPKGKQRSPGWKKPCDGRTPIRSPSACVSSFSKNS